ncbi:hypothetical protein R6Q59_007707 [Mikania micrantha]|uniref:Uncharacterized protein n=1 Tax=Mikania micrantha TaxID=192012 RepID=A0A5N6Q350_9ASTR|nr:hypothetical protein E3N88_01394 [Mikania micrantha]
MPASATLIGALLGLGTQMYSNALRKLPYMRHPWEHVLGMGLGAVFANQLVKWDAKLQEDLDKMLEKAKAANERRYFGINPNPNSNRDLIIPFMLSHMILLKLLVLLVLFLHLILEI